MSDIELKATSAVPTVKSEDAKIIVSYIIVALGIFAFFYFVSITPESGPVDLATLAYSP